MNLLKYTIKILGFHFSYNSTLKKQKKILDPVNNIQQVLCYWNSRMLLLEGKIATLKTHPISKIVYFTFLTVSNSL